MPPKNKKNKNKGQEAHKPVEENKQEEVAE